MGESLELLEAVPTRKVAGRPPLLFLHGAFGGAWVWAEHVLPFFASQGFAAHALSFRGHGASGGRALLRNAGLADYLADTRAAIQAIGSKPVLIGHSLGGLVAQLAIGLERLRGLVLLASIPPEGAFASNFRLAYADPPLWAELHKLALFGSGNAPVEPDQFRRALFSKEMAHDVAHGHLRRMQPESPRALAEAQLPRVWLSAVLARLPTLVLGAGEDRLVPTDAVWRTAWFHGAQRGLITGAPHALMLDQHWPHFGKRMLHWLEQL